MSSQSGQRRVKFFMVRNWKKCIGLAVCVMVALIIIQHNSGVQPILRAVVGVKEPLWASPQGTLGDNNHYILPDEVSPNNDGSLQVIPDNFIGIEKCPACFGLELCDEIKNGFVRVNFPDAPTTGSQHGIYRGKWHEKDVIVKKIGIQEDQFIKFEQFICRNMTKQTPCDISEVITKSFAVKPAAFVVENLQQAYKIAHKEQEALQYTVCATEGLINELKEGYGLSVEHLWTLDKAAMLYTSMVISPEVVLSKNIGLFTSPWPFPRFIGACGQLIVIEHKGVPLNTFLNTSWDKRADLALQVLNMIEFFMHGDVGWFLMYGDFEFDSFEVTSEGNVVIINMENLSIIDREAMAEYEEDEDEEPCNERCFETFVNNFMDIGNVNHIKECAQAPRVVAEAMYALACKNMLSDLPEHREAEEHGRHNGTTYKPQCFPCKADGLLHHIPREHDSDLTELLRECVHETVGGSRMHAVEDIEDILYHYSPERDKPDIRV